MKFAIFALLLCLLGAVLAKPKNSICEETFGALGSCRSQQHKWTYRRDTNECINFTYSGCQGNNNNFENKAACEKACKI